MKGCDRSGVGVVAGPTKLTVVTITEDDARIDAIRLTLTLGLTYSQCEFQSANAAPNLKRCKRPPTEASLSMEAKNVDSSD